MLVSHLDRYIGRTIIQSTLLVLAVLLILFAFFSFTDALDDYGKGRFGLYEILKYVLLTLPGWIYALFPVAALLGSILGLAWLARSSEVTAMRAAGVSLLRITGSVMKSGLVFVTFGVLIGETVVPVSETRAQRGRAEALEIGLHRKETGLWLRDGPNFVNIGEVLPDHSLLNVSIYRFDNGARLRDHISAVRARFLRPDSEFGEPAWWLEDVKSSWIYENGVSTRKAERYLWSSVLTPEVVGAFALRPEALSTWHLYRYIQHLRRNHQETGRYELAFWNKVFLPAATAVMVFLAIPFAVGQTRSRGMGGKVLLGIMLGLTFVVFSQALGHLAVGHFWLLAWIPPFLAALLPVVSFLALALHLLRRVA